MTAPASLATAAVPRGRLFPWLLVALAVAAVDQVTKALVVDRFALYDSVAVTPCLNFVRSHNTGAAFSFLAGQSGWQRWFLIAVGVGAAIFILHLLRRHSHDQPLLPFSLSTILGGAVGNIVDRLRHGYVVDWIDVHAGAAHFPSFNAADSAITLGAVCLILDELRRGRRASLAPRVVP